MNLKFWALFMITVLTFIYVCDLGSKVKKLLRSQNLETEGKSNSDSKDLVLSSLIGKKVRIFIYDDCDIQDCTYFMGSDAVTGEITGFDDTWVEFVFNAPRYEKVPVETSTETVTVTKPVKGARVTQYLRIADIESIDEVTE